MTYAVLVPSSVRSCLDVCGLNHRPILISIDTDVALDGQPAKQWLVVTVDHLSVVSDGDSPAVLYSVPWNEIEGVRTHAGVGSGLLQIRTAMGWGDVLRFSNSLAMRFHKISRMLEKRRELGDAVVIVPLEELSAEIDPPRCRKCTLRLSTPDESCPRCLHKGQVLSRLQSLLRPYWRGAFFLSLLTIIGVCAELIPPKLQQYLVDHVLANKVGETLDVAAQAPTDFKTALLIVVLALAFSRILLSAVSVIKGRLATAIGTGLTSTLRAQMVERLQNLAVAYYDRHQVGSMLSRVAHDSEVLHGLMHQITGGFLLQIVQLFGVGAMLVWINPKLALYTLIPVPLVFFGTWVFWQKVYPRYYRLWDASSKQMAVLSGMLTGVRVMKAFAQENREFERFKRTSDQLRDWRLWVEYTNATYSAAMQIVFSLGGLIVWYVGGRDVIGQEMTLGQLIAFLAYLAMFYAPLSALSNFTTWLTSFLSGSKRVLELLDTPLTINEPSDPRSWREPRGEICFDRVSFGYDRNQPVLKDVSFRVAPGEMVGIVGRSGSGKTTLVNLLGRFYDVQEGCITVDGIDIRDLSTRELRERLGIVFQESFLHRGTIWKNLSYSHPQIEIEKGLAAAKAAGAHDFICRQPLGYETVLGEHGSGLSGGEKQRLSIARTLVHDPRILVLDEATSNIDAEAEKSIQEALEVLIRGRTTVAIAHRLSTLRSADRILVFDRGELVEQGTQQELLASDGTYARLVRIQTQVSKGPSVDKLLAFGSDHPVPIAETPATRELESNRIAKAMSLSDESGDSKTSPLEWLDSSRSEFRQGEQGRLELWTDGQMRASSVFVLCTFPASHPNEYLSVRGWNEASDEIELGLIRSIDEWDNSQQELVRQTLARRYLLRCIRSINSIKLAFGFLEMDVQTQQGSEQFCMRWTQSQAVDFGERGKLLIDTEDNRYVVPDVEALDKNDRERFLQYIYW